ncbi:hypothetical protein QE152_g10508 [Popillia japonica]|uniref:DUF4219 domain-containing protein n=1 Tax=Popillia japonica TaxID=7064 RepID=A0AAW1LV03_POPJA
MGSNEEFKVPKLEETNYFPWSVRTKAALIQKQCWEAIDPGYSAPMSYFPWSVRTKAALIQKQCWEAIDPGYSAPMSENENRVNQKALSFLLLSVSDNYLEDIGISYEEHKLESEEKY